MAPSRRVEEGDFPPVHYSVRPASIVSSRMTDIASEDGDGPRAVSQGTTSNHRGIGIESRPGTAKTFRSGRSQAAPLRRGMRRGSGSNRPASAASRSHVPNLASHAFFHPMSSSKLQAQRGTPRSQQSAQQQDSASTELRTMIAQHHTALANLDAGPSASASAAAGAGRPPTEDGDMALPMSRGSRGTEMTGQDTRETFDRVTATTSPTHGHNPTVSTSESMLPLQKKANARRNLTLNVDKSNVKNFKTGPNIPSPVRSPRSFRSSFLYPKGGSGANTPKRNMMGAEKLSSGNSSPQFTGAVPESITDKIELPKPEMSSFFSRSPRAGRAGRNHEYFEGNTVFCIGGRLQNTRHRPVNIATGSLVVIPAVLFFVFSAPYLWLNVTPALPVIFAYIFFISISSFLHASGSDPGILPRHLHRFPPPDENEDPLRLAPPTNDWTLVKSAESATAAMEVPTKYCKTCNIWRPPRAHHCRLCDNCVETQDHHCVWLNNCVGRRNYRYFFVFVTSTSLLSILLVVASAVHIAMYSQANNEDFSAGIEANQVPFAMIIYGVLGFIYPAALMGYHLFLMARGETTREFLNSHKFLKKDRYRAFTQGSMWRNWLVVLCRPRPPTYHRFKARFEGGDQRFGDSKSQSKARGRGNNEQGMEMHNVGAQMGFQGPTALRNENGQALPR